MVITSDLQAHDHKLFSEHINGELTSRLQEFVDSMQFVHIYMLEKEEKKLLILGDLFEVKGYLKVPVYNLVWNTLKSIRNSGIEIYMLTGNHDQYDANGLVHSLVPFKELAKVYDRMKVDVIDGITCVFLPYRKNKTQLAEELRQIEQMELPPDSLLFMHQILEGAQISDDYYAKKEGLVLPMGIKSKFKYIISGDVHKKQRYDNIIYPGSLFARNFSDKFEEKSCIRYHNGEIEEVINPKSPIFIKHIIKSKADLHDIPLEHTAKIYLDVECTKEMLDEVHKHLRGKSNLRYMTRTIKDTPKAVKRSEVKLAMGTEEVIRNYVKYAGKGDANLVELGLSIYQEATKKL